MLKYFIDKIKGGITICVGKIFKGTMPGMRSETGTPVLSDDQINNLLMRPSPAGSVPSNSPHVSQSRSATRTGPLYKTSMLASSPATVPSETRGNKSLQNGLTSSSRLLTTEPGETELLDEDSSSCFNIFLLLKVLFFLGGLSGSTWGRYCTIFYASKGLDPFQIGVIGGTMPFVQLIAQPFWGVIADKFRNRKLVFMFTSALSTLSILSLAYDEFSDRYWKILLISAITSAFVSGGIIDAYAVDELKKRGRADDYGRLRLWAAVSWGSGNCIMGFITDKYGFSSVFYIFGGFQFFNLVLTGYFIPDRTVDEAAAIVGGKSSPPLSVLLVALTRMRVLVLLILIGVFGAGFAVVDRLLFVYLIDSFQASKLLCGLTVGMTVLFELPIFYYGKSILKTMGPQVMMAIAMVAFLIRMFGYAILTKETLNYILLLELLHGLTFAMMWTATVSIVSKISPAGWKTATMTIVQAFMYCLGGGTRSIVGGWAAQRYGFQTMYRGTGVLFCAVLLVHLTAWGCGLFNFGDIKDERKQEDDSGAQYGALKNAE